MICIDCGAQKNQPDPNFECSHQFHLSECALNMWEDAEDCTCNDRSPE